MVSLSHASEQAFSAVYWEFGGQIFCFTFELIAKWVDSSRIVEQITIWAFILIKLRDTEGGHWLL